ncbi:MAG: bifunctional diguanylate cyclase/phosphodiesterase [Pseudomonadota bacterium]
MTQIETYRRMLDVAETAPFEYRPDAERFEWADWAAAARLLNLAPAQPLDAMTAFRRTLTADSAALREREAFDPGEGEAVYCIQYEMLDAAGAAFWVEERGRWAPNPSGARALTAALRVIDDQRRREAHLQSLADVDDLTGHFSRAKLRRELDAWTADPSSREGAPAYLVAGIDDLGAINTDFGFDVADEVICNIASRIESILGAADCLGRSAGNKFGLLLSQSSTGELAERAREIISVVRSSLIDTSAGGIAASISLGAVILDDDVASSEAAMARAEAALDEARRAGRASWAVFSERTDRIGSRRRNSHLTDEILSALNERRVRIAFQPIVADVGETPRRFECLVRLVREDGAVAPAGEIIGAAERLGLVHLLDRRVLELATQVLQTTPDIRLNLNVSWETVKDPVWMDGYLAHLRAHQTVAPRLTVELTETSAVDAVEISCEFVSMIKEIGCSFAIDDFGAGYTSFRNLKAMDIDVLKIDGSFVTGVSESRDNQLFVRTLLDLARNFGVATVAEWVDNPSDAMLLKGLGVDYLQGFFIGKPELEPSWLETAPETAISRRSNPAASAAR